MKIAVGVTSVADWKEALTGNREASFVWMRSFGKETRPLAQSHERFDSPSSHPARDDLLSLWLAGPDDIAVIYQPLTERFAEHIRNVRSFLPQTLQVDAPLDPFRGRHDRLLSASSTLSALGALKHDNLYLMPNQITPVVEQISEATGIRIAGPTSQIAMRLEDKIATREMMTALGLPVVKGAACHDLAALTEVLQSKRTLDFPLIAKWALGHSGQGNTILRSASDVDTYLARAASAEEKLLPCVVECLLDIDDEIYYEMLIARDGQVTLTSAVKLGERYREMPAKLAVPHFAVIKDAAEKLAAAMFENGYFGIVGVDALIDSSNNCYPAIDINPRLNYCSYYTELAPLTNRHAQLLSRRLDIPRTLSLDSLLDQLQVKLDGLVPQGKVVITSLAEETDAHAATRSVTAEALALQRRVDINVLVSAPDRHDIVRLMSYTQSELDAHASIAQASAAALVA